MDRSDESGEDSLSAPQPLTLARLFSSGEETGHAWVDIGVGVVVVERGTAEPPRAGGKIGKQSEGGSNPPARVVVTSVDSGAVLLSTPVILEDYSYTIQSESEILTWSDPSLGRTMACSFNSKEGCDKIYGELLDIQRVHKQLRGPAAKGGKDKWAVTVENLPLILNSATTALQPFGLYVRDRSRYCKELIELFEACRVGGDAHSMDLIGRIVVALFQSPFNSEGKIIAQFVDVAAIDPTVDIVQYALGRRDAASGFVSHAERLATFKDPCELPAPVKAKIHLFFACDYLKDLLPLSLDEGGDAMATSMLSTFLLRYKCELMDEIASDPNLLPRAIAEAMERGGSEMYPLTHFIMDMTKSAKISPIDLPTRDELYTKIIDAGFVPFASAVLRTALEEIEAIGTNDVDSERRGRCCRAIQSVCEVIAHCAGQITVSSALVALLSEASQKPLECVLTLLMKTITVMRTSGGLQAVYDAIVTSGGGAHVSLVVPIASPKKRLTLQFWMEGVGAEKPPVYAVVTYLAGAFRGVVTAGAATAAGKVLSWVYGLKVLQFLAEEGKGLADYLAELLALSGIMPALKAVMKLRARQFTNLQSSAVSLLTALIELRSSAVLALLTGPDSLLEACISLYLACCTRSNVLSGSLANLFLLFSQCVHDEKRLLANPAILGNQFIHPIDDSTPAPAKEVVGASPYQDEAAFLLREYGDELRFHAPLVGSRLQHVLAETPQEAQQADVETSSIASTMDRPMVGLPAEFDMMAMAFSVDMPSRSPSTSPMKGPSGTAEMHAALRDASDDSMEELDLEADANEECILDVSSITSHSSDVSSDAEVNEEVEVAAGGEAKGTKHSRDEEAEENFAEKRQKSEESSYVR